MPSAVLKALASALTIGAATLSSLYVTGHVKNAGAPLHPTLIGRPVASAAMPGGRLHLTPSVRGGDVTPVSSTYAS